jgi:SAM-dependent methyltransferase
LQRGPRREREEWIESANFAVTLLCRTLGRADLGGVDVLDVGCGTKVAKVLLDQSLPIGRYVGIDVSATIIDWLRAHVSDPRFEFHDLDAHNELYNPSGVPLADFERLPVGPARFDLICLFSVFTHLAPNDYVAMLHLLRKHVKPDGTLLFSLFLNDPEHPSVFARAVKADLVSDDPAVVAAAKAAVAEVMAAKAGGFHDEVPDQPLLRARYDKDYALELIDGTGWEVVSVNPPEQHIQHYIVCRPG